MLFACAVFSRIKSDGLIFCLVPRGHLTILSIIKRLFGPRLVDETVEIPTPVSGLPKIYPRPDHNISRSQISENALKVLYRLKKEGYQAYLVGGCVRDLLLGREPKDFDVATDASPEEVRQVFRNCRLIGRRFRLAHVHFGQEIIEVATFRGLDLEAGKGERVLHNGRILRDNVYGSIEEDAFRRDFSVNALYYNINDFSVVDYVGGMEDHQAGVMRLIGDPVARYREDPVRMLRAVRFSVRLGFKIHSSAQAPIRELSGLLQELPPARLFDEVLKLLLTGYAVQTFEQLRQFGLFGALFPDTERALAREPEGYPLTFLAKSLERTDLRVSENKPVTPYFLFAALLWEPVRLRAAKLIEGGASPMLAYQDAGEEVIRRQLRLVSIPKSVTLPIRDVWLLQARFDSIQGGRAFRLLAHPKFRAAYDFLALRAETGEADAELANWWTRFQFADEAEQKAMVRSAGNRRTSRNRTQKRRSRRKPSSNAP